MNQINVLFVDDEEELVATWVERINLRGIHADGVTNGHDALQYVKDNNYDIVVLDIKMPGLGGIAIMNEIVKFKPNIQIILITGHQCSEEETKNFPSNAFDCLVKPVDIEILIDKIKSAVKK